MPSDFIHANTLVINDFNYVLDTTYSLNWKTGDQSHRVLINKTKQSINFFDFQTTDHNQVSDLHILIEPNTELGNDLRFQQTASFKSLLFDSIEKQNVLAAHISEWTDFTPIKFNSINGYTSSQDHHLKYLILRLSAWVLFCVALFVVTKISGFHLVLTITIAWLFTAFFHINNHMKQNQQLHMAFSTEDSHINPLDQSAAIIADSIKADLNNPQIMPEDINKLVLLGQNNFFNLRLVHHLLEYNIGLSLNFERIFSSNNKQHAFILLNNAYRYCIRPDRYDWLIGQADIISINDQYCIMRKK